MRALGACVPVLLGLALQLGACSDATNDDATNDGGTSSGGSAGSSQAGSSRGGGGSGGSTATGGSKPMGTAGDSAAGGAGGSDSDFTPPRGACAFEKRVGRFSVEAQKDFGVVQGTVLDGVVPTSIPEPVSEEAGCKVLKRRNLVCSPACVGAETCGEAGSCIPYPHQVSVGKVTIAGLTKPVAMEPQMPGAVYFAPGADNPPFEPQDEIVLAAAGAGDSASFQLFGLGSEPLKEAPTWVLEKGKDFELEWAEPSSGSGTRILVELTIDQHGQTPLSLSCDLDDTGHATIPTAILDQLITSGVSGFPNGRIQRRSVDHVELGDGCVELSVGSALAATVRVAGFTPCKSDKDCPDDQTCNTVLEKCE